MTKVDLNPLFLVCYKSIITQPQDLSRQMIGYSATGEKCHLGELAFGLGAFPNKYTYTRILILVSFGDAFTLFKIMGSDHHRVIRPGQFYFVHVFLAFRDASKPKGRYGRLMGSCCFPGLGMRHGEDGGAWQRC